MPMVAHLFFSTWLLLASPVVHNQTYLLRKQRNLVPRLHQLHFDNSRARFFILVFQMFQSTHLHIKLYSLLLLVIVSAYLTKLDAGEELVNKGANNLKSQSSSQCARWIADVQKKCPGHLCCTLCNLSPCSAFSLFLAVLLCLVSSFVSFGCFL